MSVRVQESTAAEVSAVARSRPMSLVLRNFLSARQTSPRDSGASNSLGNYELDRSSASWSARKLVRDNDQDPTSHSHKWQQGDSFRERQEPGAV